MIVLRRLAIIGIIVILSTLILSVGSADALPRSQVIARAKSWVSKRVPYSQVRRFLGYRADCSGFVSYAMGLRAPGDTTVSLWRKTRPIGKNDLKAGDLLLAPGRHVVMFTGWANSARTKYHAYEQAGGRGAVSRVMPYPYALGHGRYSPRRHPSVSDYRIAVSRGAARQTQRMKMIRKYSDFNGDGISDISFLYDGFGNRRSQWLFRSTKAGFTPLNAWFGKAGTFYANSMKEASGDFNGDGKTDIAVLYRNPNKSTSIFVFYSHRDGRIGVARAWTSKPGGFDWWRVKMTSGDFNGDGRDDLAFFHGAHNGQSTIWVFLARQKTGFSPQRWWTGRAGAFDWNRAKMVSGDFGGDGRTDLAFIYDYVTRPTTIWVFSAKSNGSFYPKIWWSAKPNTFKADRIKAVSGYFNWDNKADLAMLYSEPNGSSSAIVLYPNGSSSFSSKMLWRNTAADLQKDKFEIAAGDYNADGLSDLAAVYANAAGRLSVRVLTNANNSKVGFKDRIWWIDATGKYAWPQVNLAN